MDKWYEKCLMPYWTMRDLSQFCQCELKRPINDLPHAIFTAATSNGSACYTNIASAKKCCLTDQWTIVNQSTTALWNYCIYQKLIKHQQNPSFPGFSIRCCGMKNNTDFYFLFCFVLLGFGLFLLLSFVGFFVLFFNKQLRRQGMDLCLSSSPS